MQDELSVRQAAIRLRLAGESVESICRTLKRSEAWFYKWWRRYLESGPEGLYDLTRGNRQVTNQTPPHIERAVISVRRRLAARATPQTRYSRIGAAQIRAELEALGHSPLPCLRTINHIIARAGLSCPPLRLAPGIARNEYPGPQARDSNHVHQVDVVGPRYLKGRSPRYYYLLCKDVFDQSIYMEFVDSRKMDVIMDFLVHAMTTVNEQHVHSKLGGRTAAQYRRGKWLRKLPANFALDEAKLPVAVGKVTFIRLVSAQGTVSILGQSFKVGKRFKFQYVKATIYTKYQKLKVYHKGKLIKEFPYPLSQK